MKTTVKKWAFSLVLLSLMASCGGDNNTTDPDPREDTTNQVNGNYSGTTQGARNEDELASEIASGNFAQDSSRVYRAFYKKRSTYSDWESVKDSFDFEFCWNGSCSGSTENLPHRKLDGDQFSSNVPVDIFSGSLAGLKQKLVDLVQSGNRIYKCGNYYGYYGGYGCADLDEVRNSSHQSSSIVLDDRSRVFVIEKNSKQYMINLNMPLIANPVSILNLNTGERYDYADAQLR